MRSTFVPEPSESYLDAPQLGARWSCHPKTASKRFKKLGGTQLLMGGRVLFPLSVIISLEHEAISKFAARETKVPEQFAQARERRERERQARRLRKRTAALGQMSQGISK
jgi:hypothetical protein